VTPEEAKAEADEAVRRFSTQISTQSQGSGLPKPPSIEVSEVSLNTLPISFLLNRGQKSQVFPGPPPQPPITDPTGACCFGTSCSILTAAACSLLGGVYQGDGTLCSPNPC
jgi:hypothetical protein